MLVADRLETIRPVLDRLAEQTAREQLEVVLAGPNPDRLRDPQMIESFAAVEIVQVGSPIDLGEARAVAVRAASAPLVFIGETHSYPHPTMAEELIRAHDDGPWTAVVPAFCNANPDGALSWAGFLSDYGAWAPSMPGGEIDFAPMYNASYRREALLEFGDGLGSALRGGDEMALGLRARNRRVRFEPTARIDHLNLSRPVGAWLSERYFGGVLIAAGRARRWPLWRRLLYFAATPLLPAVYLSRIRAGIAAQRRAGGVSPSVLALILASALLKAVGELVGYARGDRAEDTARMTDFEVNRLAYTSVGAR